MAETQVVTPPVAPAEPPQTDTGALTAPQPDGSPKADAAPTPTPTHKPGQALVSTSTAATQQGTQEPDAPTVPEKVLKTLQGVTPEELTELKRIVDKKTHLADLDRQISEAQRRRDSTRPQEPAQPQQATPQAQPAKGPDLGFSGEQWLAALNANPQEGLAMLTDAVLKQAREGVREEIPNAFREQQFLADVDRQVTDIRRRLASISPEHAAGLDNVINVYREQGWAPTPEQLENEVMFGPPAQIRQLCAYALQAMNQQPSAQQPAPAQAAPSHPMAPGGGPNVAPTMQGTQKTRPLLSNMGWNV